MTPKAVAVLGLLAGLSYIAATAAGTRLTGWSTREGAEGPVVPGFAERIGDAAKIVVQGGDATFTLTREGDRWFLAELNDYPADPAKIEANLAGLAELTRREPKTRDPELYDRLEVEDPDREGAQSHRLEVLAGDGRVLASLIVGRKNYRAWGGIYVRVDGEDRAWLTGGEIGVTEGLVDWIDTSLTGLALAEIEAMTVTRGEAYPLRVFRTDDDARAFTMAKLPNDLAPKSSFGLERVVQRVAEVEFDDARPATEAGEPASITRLEATDGLAVTITLYKDGEEHWVEVAAAGSGPTADRARGINDRFNGWQLHLPARQAEKLTVTIADVLRDAPS